MTNVKVSHSREWLSLALICVWFGGDVSEIDRWIRSDEVVERPDSTTPMVDSRDLLKGGNEVVIRHGEERYRLRLTRQKRLILNK